MFSKKMLLLFALVMPAAFIQCHAQESDTCPVRSGVYAKLNGEWRELELSQAQKEKLRGGPFKYNVIATYDGDSSKSVLNAKGEICVSAAPLGSTFAIAKAKASKNDRQVTIGTMSINSTFTFDIDKKQAIPSTIKRDVTGNYILSFSNLESGQYLVFLQQGSSISRTPPAFSFMVK